MELFLQGWNLFQSDFFCREEYFARVDLFQGGLFLQGGIFFRGRMGKNPVHAMNRKKAQADMNLILGLC